MKFQDVHGNAMYGAWKHPIAPKRNLKHKKLSGWLVFLVLALAIPAMAVVTQIDLTQQVKGILAFANGGTGASTLAAGVARSNGTVLSTAELSGDATTSTSNAVTVVKVNGTSVPTNAAADQVVVTTSSATGAWKTISGTEAGGLAVTYNATTHAFGTIAVVAGTFADNETPTGTPNGTLDTFTLASSPSPALSLQLHKNGQLMIAGGADFTLTTNSCVFVAGAIPKTGDVLRASYRH
jgi:hypothetical protein